jgi:hypothetical protein
VTRSGVASQAAGSNSGTASTSATVVVPVRNSICAPSRQEAAKSSRDQDPFKATIDVIQSVKLFGGGIKPAIRV